MPLVSVVVPTRDRLPLLREALDSVAAQTFGDWECLVCDDGSTDGTAAAVEELGRRDGRFRLVPLETSGVNGKVRNEGIRASSAPLVAFLDDDDVWLPGKLGSQVADLATHPGVGLSFGQVERFGAGSGVWPRRLPRTRVALAELLGGNCVPTSTVVARRETLLRAGLFPEDVEATPDYELWLRVARHEDLLAREEFLVRYRVHAGNISRRKALEVEELTSLYARLEREWGLSPRLLAPARRGILRQRARSAPSLREAVVLWLRALGPLPPSAPSPGLPDPR